MDLATKPRCDAWDAALSDGQRWSIYDKFRQGRWYDVAAWAMEEFSLAEIPSRAGMYRFADRMRKLESAHRIESALTARDEAGALVAAKTDDVETINAYKALAQDMALTGDRQAAIEYTQMALSLAAQLTKTREIELKAAAQGTKDAQLRLAREKFEAAEKRLNSVKDAVTDTKLSPAEREAKLKEIFGL